MGSLETDFLLLISFAVEEAWTSISILQRDA